MSATSNEDIVERLRYALDLSYPMRDWRLFKDSLTEVERLRAQIAELQRYAERYRWLRELGVRYTADALAGSEYNQGDELDEAIDKAMKHEDIVDG